MCVCACVCVCVCVCHDEKKVPDKRQERQAMPAILQVSSSTHNTSVLPTEGFLRPGTQVLVCRFGVGRKLNALVAFSYTT